MVYQLLAGALFAGLAYGQIWHRLVAGLGGLAACSGPDRVCHDPRSASARPGPLRELFVLLRGPGAAAGQWRGLLVCAVDGTIMTVADSPANLAAYSKQRGGATGGGSYPTLRLLTLASCGTHSAIGTVFGPVSAARPPTPRGFCAARMRG